MFLSGGSSCSKLFLKSSRKILQRHPILLLERSAEAAARTTTTARDNRFFSSSSGSSSPSSSSLKDSYEYILAEKHEGGVGVITLNRPKALNALCDALFDDLIHAGQSFQNDEEVGCLVVTGSTKAFAAGADISEMSNKTYPEAYKSNMFAQWAQFSQVSKPIIAAVNGFALGGGCELAMMCDIIVAGDRAKFGQPEINLGVIPGAGGTQRLIRQIGKSKAMHMILTGDMMTAQEAYEANLVAKVFPADELLTESVRMGQKIAQKGQMSTIMAKECVNAAEELSLTHGLQFERRLFQSLFSTNDQKEGMKAFLEKRDPKFTNT